MADSPGAYHIVHVLIQLKIVYYYDTNIDGPHQ